MNGRTVAVFSSHVARGTVGLRAAALALEALGNHVWSIPTIQLPHHPGHGVPARIVADDTAFYALVDGLTRSEWLGELDAIVCGYFATVGQVETVARFIDQSRATRDVLVVVDPVLGDHGRLYIPEPVAEAIRETLLPRAHIITPNRFEMQWLASAPPFENNMDALAAIQALADQKHVPELQAALVTSSFAMMEGGIGSLLWWRAHGGDCAKPAHPKSWLAEHRSFDRVPNGLGDLTASVLTHHWLAGAQPAHTLERTTASVADVLKRTMAAGHDELAVESNLISLTRPATPVHVQQMMLKRPKR